MATLGGAPFPFGSSSSLSLISITGSNVSQIAQRSGARGSKGMCLRMSKGPVRGYWNMKKLNVNEKNGGVRVGKVKRKELMNT